MKLLTRLRVSRGWTKYELARRADLHPSQVGQIESGRMRPYPGQLLRLAAAIGYPEDQAEQLLEDERNDCGAA